MAVSPTCVPGWLPSYCGSGNFSARVVIDLATEREKRKQAESGGLRPPRIVELLAQAEEFQPLLDSGEATSRADLARRFTMSRARVTQIMNLLRLDRALLVRLRALPAGTPPSEVSERRLRKLLRDPVGQRRLALTLVATQVRSA